MQFSSDRPISSNAQDRLGRSGFAKALATSLQGWTGNDSLTVAVYGPWGSGKSSVKNMVLETLGETADVLEFNPWQFAGQEQLFDAFFVEIGKKLGRIDTSKAGKAIAKKWRRYHAGSKLGGDLATEFSKVLPLWFVILGSVGTRPLPRDSLIQTNTHGAR